MNDADSLHPLGNTLLRTPETFAKYHDNPKREAKECFICKAKAIAQWKYWKIIENNFPYDAVAKVHLMLVPKSHSSDLLDLSWHEKNELEDLKDFFSRNDEFDCIIENLARGRTFMPHYHLHLIQWKRL